MPDLRPFRGLRFSPKAGDLEDLVAPPYDVIGAEQYQVLCRRSPHNVVRLILDKGYSPDVLPPPEWYDQAAALLDAWRRAGILALDADPAFYLYSQVFPHRGRLMRRKLLLGALRLEAYGAGRIFPHENTTPGPKISRLRLMQACKANLSPILAFFPDPDGAINRALDELGAERPVVAFTDHEGIEHELRRIADTSQQYTLSTALAPLPLYIADGHHRYETALVYRDIERARLGASAATELPLDFMLTACMSGADPGLIIRPTHRVVTWQGDFWATDFLDEAEEWFSARKLTASTLQEALAVLDARRDESLFIIYEGRAVGYIVLQLRSEEALRDAPYPLGSPLRKLPAAVFSQAFLAKLPGLRGATVTYTADPEVAIRQADANERSLACLLPSVSPGELMSVVDAGERMPPKSTYFWPKPMTGMVLRSLAVF